MQIARATGPQAAARKYDILTALLVLGQYDHGTHGRLAQRLALLITARFSWRTETFCVGVRELGKLWGVTERTAKREMAQLRTFGWISVHRAATRGRVAEHRIHIAAVLNDTRQFWDAVGPDFAARMGQGGEPEDQTVVPFPTARAASAPVSAEGTLWPAIAEALNAADAALYQTWFAKLAEADCGGGCLTLTAPSAFVRSYIETHLRQRLIAAARLVQPSLRELLIIC